MKGGRDGGMESRFLVACFARGGDGRGVKFDRSAEQRGVVDAVGLRQGTESFVLRREILSWDERCEVG